MALFAELEEMFTTADPSFTRPVWVNKALVTTIRQRAPNWSQSSEITLVGGGAIIVRGDQQHVMWLLRVDG